MAKGTGECPIYKRKRKYADKTEYFIYAFDLILSDGSKKTFYSTKNEKKGDFQKRKNQIMLQYQKTVNVSLSFIEMNDFLDNWLKQKRDISPNTQKVYSDYINSYIKPFIGTIRLQKVMQDDVDRLISHLQVTGGKSIDTDGNEKDLKPLAPSTLRKVKFILKQAFDYAIDKEMILKNPTKKVILPKMVKPTNKPFTKDDILKCLQQTNYSPMYYAILLDISTGLRRGELLALRWQDVDLKSGIANITRQLVPAPGGVTIVDNLKTEKSTRRIVIPDKVLIELKEWLNVQIIYQEKYGNDYFDTGIDNDLIVRQENGKHYNPRNFARCFDKILKDAGLEKHKIHDMRHTFATQLLSTGAYITEVQQSLGHADAKTTLQNYSHILPGRQKEVANRMNNILPI